MPRSPYVWYVYPMWHRVSFTLIAEKHVEQLRRWYRVERVDELAFPHIMPVTKPVALLHPYFFIMMRSARFVSRKLHLYRAIIGVDVADSDHITSLAVSMTDYANAMIVPSSFSRQAYVRSGVRVPVHVVPHALDMEWYDRPNIASQYFQDLVKLKERRGYKYLLYFLWHSDFRKGADLVIEIYKRLIKERRDVRLILKTATANGRVATILRSLGAIHVHGWLTEEQKMALYDTADIYILASRGGGFEMNGLEAIARGLPTIAARGGSWEDYLPDFLLVDSRPTPYVLKDNPIHDGKGVEMIVENAIDKLHDILENMDDYRARVREHVNRIRHIYNWDSVGAQLAKIVANIMDS